MLRYVVFLRLFRIVWLYLVSSRKSAECKWIKYSSKLITNATINPHHILVLLHHYRKLERNKHIWGIHEYMFVDYVSSVCIRMFLMCHDCSGYIYKYILELVGVSPGQLLCDVGLAPCRQPNHHNDLWEKKWNMDIKNSFIENIKI